MADFEITETPTVSRSVQGFSKNYTLEAGEKLSDDDTLIAIAGKTVPAGYRVRVNVDVNVLEVEKL